MSSPWTNQAISLIILTEQTTGFSGLFGYSPAPGAGNLIFSLSAAAGTDEYGNTYPQGLGVGASADPQISLMPLSGGAAQIQFPMAAVDLEAPAAITADADGASAAEMIINGPQLEGSGQNDFVQIQLWSNGSGIYPSAYLEFDYIAAGSGSYSASAIMTGTGWTFAQPVNLLGQVSPPSTPEFGAILYYYAGTLYALGSSGVPVALATT